MALDLNDSYKKAKSRVSATQIVVETKKKELELKKNKQKVH